MGEGGKRALCSVPCLLAGPPPCFGVLGEHPLDPEGEEKRLCVPSSRRARQAPLTCIPNPGRGALLRFRLATQLQPNIAQAQVRAGTGGCALSWQNERSHPLFCRGQRRGCGRKRCGWSLGGGCNGRITMTIIPFLCPSWHLNLRFRCRWRKYGSEIKRQVHRDGSGMRELGRWYSINHLFSKHWWRCGQTGTKDQRDWTETLTGQYRAESWGYRCGWQCSKDRKSTSWSQCPRSRTEAEACESGLGFCRHGWETEIQNWPSSFPRWMLQLNRTNHKLKMGSYDHLWNGLPEKVELTTDQESQPNYNLWDITTYRKYILQEVQWSEKYVKEHSGVAISKIQTKSRLRNKWPGYPQGKPEREREW